LAAVAGVGADPSLKPVFFLLIEVQESVKKQEIARGLE
jgi:hypothetical protein